MARFFFFTNPDFLSSREQRAIYLILTIGQEGIPTATTPFTNLRGTSLLVRPRDIFVKQKRRSFRLKSEMCSSSPVNQQTTVYILRETESKLESGQVVHSARTFPGFLSMKRTRVFLFLIH